MLRIALPAACIVAALIASGTATAKEQEGQNYVVPMATGVWVDDDRVLDDEIGFHLGIGRAVSETWNVELNVTGSQHDGPIDADFFGVGIDAMRVWYRERMISPYLLFGAGHLETDFEGAAEDDSNIMGSLGVGFLTDFGASPVALRTELRLRGGFGEGNELIAGLGLHFPFGAKAAPADSDGDGVPDERDRCPGTPAGTPVDEYGCERDSDGDGVPDSRDKCPDTPRGAEVDEDGCEPDSDGDGVPDSRDKCPDTPPGAEVDEDGCELDDDGDGVVNSRDRCPDTRPGARVDVNGCELTEEIRLRGVHFAFDSAEILPGAERVLDDSAETLRRYPDLVVEVAGHTDSVGTDAYNLDLSQRRAESVRQYLIDKGVDSGNLSAKGYGESQPIESNDTEEGRDENRRVNLRILNKEVLGES